MTLIICAATSKKIYQVSDTRLTMLDGVLDDDFSLKAVVVPCKNAFVSIAYSGIAKLGNLRTDNWLVKTLSKFQVHEKTLLEVAEHIKSSATMEIKRTNSPKIPPLTFALIGWCFNKKHMTNVPTYGAITNFEDKNLYRLGTPLDSFEIRAFNLKEDAKLNKIHPVQIHGMEDAIEERYFRKRLNKFVFNKLNDDTNPNEIVKELVKFVRIAAGHIKYGKYIGKNCSSVYFDVGSTLAHCFYHSVDNKKKSYMPSIITKYYSLTGIEIEKFNK